MKKALRYNELDELAWEAEHGCVEPEEDYDPYWDKYSCFLHQNPQDEDFAEDDETGAGIFGNELNHEQNAKSEPSGVVSNGKVFGHGEKDEIIRTIFDLLAPCRDYHFEFGFFEAK